MTYANTFLITNLLFYVAIANIILHFAANLSRYLLVSKIFLFVTSKSKPKCLIYVVGIITDFDN